MTWPDGTARGVGCQGSFPAVYEIVKTGVTFGRRPKAAGDCSFDPFVVVVGSGLVQLLSMAWDRPKWTAAGGHRGTREWCGRLHLEVAPIGDGSGWSGNVRRAVVRAGGSTRCRCELARWCCGVPGGAGGPWERP